VNAAGRALALAGSLVLACAACVTEVAPHRPGAGPRPAPNDAQPNTPGAAQPALPDGPLATPAPGANTSSRVQVTVQPLGRLEYDAQTLPLVSPDGRFVAVQSGQAPSWEAILGEDGAQVLPGTRVRVVEIVDATRDDAERLREVALAGLPAGVMLGRDASTRGVLIEWPRTSGERWIGILPWAGGTIDWVAQGDGVNALGAFVGESLAFVRRAKNALASDLVLASAGSESAVALGPGFHMPLATLCPDAVFVVTSDDEGLRLRGFALSGDAPARIAHELAPLRIGGPGDASVAYQVGAAFQPSAVAPASDCAPDAEPACVFFHPVRGRAMIYHPASATLRPLAPASFAAARLAGQGWLATVGDGVVFVADQGDAAPARVVASPSIVRSVTTNGAQTFILLGPSAASAGHIEVVRMAAGGAQEP